MVQKRMPAVVEKAPEVVQKSTTEVVQKETSNETQKASQVDQISNKQALEKKAPEKKDSSAAPSTIDQS
jgi:hypothetical protein